MSRHLNFIRNFSRSSANFSHAGGDEAGHIATQKLWKNLSLFVAIPAVALVMLNTYLAHVEHEAHDTRPEFVPYEHLRLRSKRYPWGDGVKSFIHNPHVNALPTGYEDGH